MSSFDAETQAQQSKGPEAFLSYEERLALKRSLGFPEELPAEHKEWVLDYVSTNIELEPYKKQTRLALEQAAEAASAASAAIEAVSAALITVTTAAVAGSVNTTSGSFVTVSGPEITGLADGTYVIFFGAALHNSGGGSNGAEASLEVNGSAALGADQITNYGVTSPFSMSRALVKSLSSGSNSLEFALKIANGGTAFAENMWIVALRIGPAS